MRDLVVRAMTTSSAALLVFAFGVVALAQTRFPDAKPSDRITLLIVGDSTVADYPKGSPLMGWGQAIRELVDDRVTIVNAARNGRSSKSFRAEGLWDAARKTKADYAFIQFGHNDNRGKGPDRETDPAPGGDFRQNLSRYIAEARAMGATPILVTPPARRNFGVDGRIDSADANGEYAAAALAVAEQEKCAVVDLFHLSQKLFDELGDGRSASLQTPADRTHFSPAGARRMALFVLGAAQEVVPNLRPFVRQDELSKKP